MTQISVQPIEVNQDNKDVVALSERSKSLVISNQDEYTSASDVLKQVKARYKELDTQRKDIVKPLDDAKKKIQELFKTPLDLLSAAETKIKSLMVGYVNEQERIAREKQAELQRLADLEAEKERKKIEARIERAKASGKDEKVEALEEQKENIEPVSVPVVAPTIETPKGMSFREQWTAEVVDFAKLPDEYKLPNQSALNKIAQATKGTISIPGVKLHSEKIPVSRG